MLEEEGIFGLSVGLVAATTEFTVGIATTVTSAALGAVSGTARNVGRLFTGTPASTELYIANAVSRDMEAPVLEKITTTVPQMVLDIAFPVLTSPLVVLRLLAPNYYSANNDTSTLLLQAYSTSEMSFHTGKSHGSVNSDHNAPDDTLNAAEEARSSTTTDSGFRTDRTSSLSTLSESSEVITDDSEEDAYDEFLRFIEKDDEKLNNSSSNDQGEDMLDVNAQNETELSRPEETTATYYLDFTALFQDEHDKIEIPLTKRQDNRMFYILQNSPQQMQSFRCVLDTLVQSALDLAKDDSANIDNKCCIVWKPEGDTKKTMQRMQRWSFDDRTKELAKTVMKWTGVLKNKKGELRMIKTRGIVNMSPLDLKDLLIDCSRGHLVNKNSLGKKDVCKFDCEVGTTTIVENAMKIPFVGGEVHSVSLTHSRLVEKDPAIRGDLYVIVSKSVQYELDKSTGLPYYSISVLRPVGNDAQKTDLINVAQISDVPVPKFMVNKIAFSGAVDFFSNIRSI